MRSPFSACVVASPLVAFPRPLRLVLTAAAFLLSCAGAAGAAPVYWNVFNIEGERAVTADIVTYGTLMDMLLDTNRLGVFQPTAGGAGQNVVGSGSDGSTYWNVFNIEGERAVTADLVTYGTLMDMLLDTNRLGVFQPTAGGAGQNVVGSGSDGSTYWNVFNIEGERAVTADIVTYGTLMDMLLDTNRLGVFQPTAGGAGQNVVGSGAGVLASPPPPVPEPLASVLFTAGLLGVAVVRRLRRPVA
jgi:hypothetical protein